MTSPVAPSCALPDDEPLDQAVAKALIAWILDHGDTTPSGHGTKQMLVRKIEMTDVVNICRNGQVAPPEWENGSWRYTISTPQIAVVVVFRSTSEMVVVTAWRIKP